MRLAGVDLNQITSLEEGLLEDRIFEKNQIRFYSVLAIVHAIQEAAKVIASGSGGFDNSARTLKTLRGYMFPEYAEALEEKAARSQELLEKEHARGPMKVQRLDYATDKKKKRRRK